MKSKSNRDVREKLLFSISGKTVNLFVYQVQHKNHKQTLPRITNHLVMISSYMSNNCIKGFGKVKSMFGFRKS